MKSRTRFYITSFLVILLGTLPGCSSTRVYSKAGTVTTVVLIRHADRHNSTHLNELGRQRAQILVEEVKDLGITAIYSPNVERNLDTVKPLAEHLGIDITITPKISLPVANRIVNEIITKHSGKAVLWVGNVSGNLQAIYKNFGGTGKGPLEYGDLFILKVKDKGPSDVVKKRFGPPSQEIKKK